jgi:HPt (histidine-containing phosphotransfer) domain-containing protein
MHPSTTPLDAPSVETAIDPEVYGALAEIMEGEMISLVNDFLSSTGELLAQVAAAESVRDPLTMKLHAHSIKSSAATIGALPLSELARALEARAASGQFEGLAHSSAAMHSEFARARTELERLAAAARGH